MPITCITGTPGAGKTLSALEELFKELKINVRGKTPEQLRHELNISNPRPVFVCNVRGLRPGMFEELETPWDWEELPDGSLVLVDEAWEFFGKHLRNGDDPRILNFAKHRHRGFDFIFTTQAPSQLAPFMRDLLGRHVHVTRKFGTETTIRYEWPHVQDNPNSQTAKANAIESVWQYPHEVFSLYESATLHTVKRKIPAKVITALVFAALSLVATPAAFYLLWNSFSGPAEASTPTLEAPPSSARSAASTERKAAQEGQLTTEEYVYQRTPRVEADPASAPLYDQFEVQDYPRMFCVISGDQRIERISCRCRTQQMTPVLVDDRVCIRIARDGYWDPRLRPSGDRPRESGSPFDASPQMQPASVLPGIPAPAAVAGAGGGIDRSIQQSYVPPDYLR